MSADGGLAVFARRGKQVVVWDLAGKKPLHTLAGHTEQVTSVALLPDGCRAISGSDDGTVRVWNTTTGVVERTLEGHSGPVNAVAIDGQLALSGSTDRTVKHVGPGPGVVPAHLRGSPGQRHGGRLRRPGRSR
jgi:WD40 repeat protein